MATEYAFGKIVTNGLVLSLDAADKNSYTTGSIIWNDLTSNNNNATIVSGSFSGSNGGNIVFAGTGNQHATINSGSSINNLASSSFSMWLNWTEPTSVTSTSFLYKSDDNNTAGWFIGVNSTYGGIGMTVVANTNKRYYLATSETPARNTWYMLTVTWQGNYLTTGGISIYINGVKNTNVQTDNAGVGSRNTDANQVLDIANQRIGSFFFFGGRMGIIQIYNKVLSDTEILQNYNAQKSRFDL